MITNKNIGNIMVISGIGVLVYEFLLNDLSIKKDNTIQYSPLPVNPYALNDDRKTYYSKDGDKSNYVKGYDLPEDIESLETINNTIMIMTLPDITLYDQPPRSGLDVQVNKQAKTIIYKGNSLNYNDLKGKIAIMDKKYIKK